MICSKIYNKQYQNANIWKLAAEPIKKKSYPKIKQGLIHKSHQKRGT
jgi:hypothetical protein